MNTTKENRKRNAFLPKPFDFVIYAAILICAALIWLIPHMNRTEEYGSEIEVRCGDMRYSYSLSEDNEYSFVNNGVCVVVKVESGKAFVSYADCPDGICMKSGKISVPGESIICAPAKISVKVTGKEGHSDALAS